jgi:SAM-dependent methyltransferase
MKADEGGKPTGRTDMDIDMIIAANRHQAVSEEDTFTVARYLSFVRHVPRGTVDVLDVGCNTGRGGAAMKARMPSLLITGLDCVPERLQRLDPSVYHQSIASFSHEIPLPSGAFDAIVAGEFIEHVPPPYVFPSLCEFFRLLRLRGRLLLTTPNPHSLKNRVLGLSVLLDQSHLSQHTPASLRRRLQDVGFSNVKIYGSGRVSRILGPYAPIRCLYGSYLSVARKW